MNTLAIALVILGISALGYGIFGFFDSRTTIEMGSMSASITEDGATPMAALVIGGIALVSGLVLLSNERRRA